MLTVANLPANALENLLSPFQIQIKIIPLNKSIPGSYWGESEAGLIKNKLYIRSDTPVHSALHEACHFICMDSLRRNQLNTDAAGDYDEENAVCYLQILLAAKLRGCSAAILMENMDSWGYTFRLGSTLCWYIHDATEARQWLINEHIIQENNEPTWILRR